MSKIYCLDMTASVRFKVQKGLVHVTNNSRTKNTYVCNARFREAYILCIVYRGEPLRGKVDNAKELKKKQ